MRKRSMLLLSIVTVLSLSVSAMTAVFAQSDEYTAGIMESVPAYAEGCEDHMRAEVAAAASGFSNATGALKAVIEDNDRILLAQQFLGGTVFMNEPAGKAFSVFPDNSLLAAWQNGESPKGVILAHTRNDDGEYFVTDTVTLKNAGGTVTETGNVVGKLPEDYAGRVTADRLSDRFADAYKFAVNYNADEFTLGIPTGNVTAEVYTTRNLEGNGKNKDGSAERTYYKQAFEGGYIIQARLDKAPHYAAAAISSDMYAKVTGLEGNAGLNVTGAPVGRQHKVGSVIYQNFEYGYVKVTDGAIEFVADKAVSSKGTEMSRIIASFEDNWDTAFNKNYLHIEREQVRKSEQIVEAVGAFIDAGKKPYDGFGEDISKHNINWPCHEFGGRGALLKMSSSTCGTAVGGRNSFVVVGYWYAPVQMINNADFTPNGAYFKEGENKVSTGDVFSGPGFPISPLTTYKNVKYQEFNNGVIYQAELDETYTCVKGDAFTEWMTGYKTVEEALAGHKIAFDPKPIVEYTVEKGTYKAADFDKNTEKVTVSYEGKSFEITGALYVEWMGEVETFAQACAVNGVPVYGCEDYLVTTKYYFEMKNGVAEKQEGLGTLDLTEEDKVFGDVTYSENVKKIITDSFADAYMFANIRNEHLLGKPVAGVISTSFVDTASEEQVSYLVQQFENGVIIQSAYNNPAVAIFGKVVEAVDALGGYGNVGLPIARQYEFEGVTYCNFTFGYIKIPAAGEAEIVLNAAVGTKGNEIDRNIGRFENRANVKKGHIDFEHELLRIYEAYVAEYERVTADGFRLFTGSVRQGHEWNGNGITQSYIAGGSTSTAWGQQKLSVMVMKTPYEKAYVVRNIILDFYAQKGGNNQPGNFGMPTSEDFSAVVKCLDEDGNQVDITVTFQNFEKGVIYSYVNTIDEVYVSAVEQGVANRDGKVFKDGKEVELDIDVGKELPPLPPDSSEDNSSEPVSSSTQRGCKNSLGGTGILFGSALVAAMVMFGIRKRKENE